MTYLMQRALTALALSPQPREPDLQVRSSGNLFLIQFANSGSAIVADRTLVTLDAVVHT